MVSQKGRDNEGIEADEHAQEVSPLVPGKGQGAGVCNLNLVEKAPVCEWITTALGIESLSKHFGYKLLVMLFASQHLMKGFAAAFTAPCSSFLYRSYKVPGPQMQIYGGVTQLPWAMKPVIGLISDALPVFGYNKAPYMLLASLLGMLACGCVGVLPQTHFGVDRLVACLFLMQLQFSTCDLLVEAKYAEKMQSKPEHGPALMTFVWFGLQVGGLVAIATVGPIMHHFGPKVPYLIALLPASFIIVPVAKNYLDETQKSPNEALQDRALLMEQKEACFLCGLMFAGTIALTVLGISFESAAVNAGAAVAVAVIMLLAFSIVLRPIIAKVNAFFLIQTSLGVSIGGASFYFYVDTPEQYPEGPHFSMEFFTSVLGVVGSICSLLGIYMYQKYASNWTYRGLLLVSNLALSVLSVSDVIMFTRLNVRWGIPDQAFVLGASVLTSVIAQWMWMPGVVILSQLCPKGMEATMYALLAGCHNLGNTIASNCGALLLEWLGCQPGGNPAESAQFKNLWIGSVVSTVLPVLTLVMMPWLIPDARQTDKLLEDGDRDATRGSLWRRWTEGPSAREAPGPAAALGRAQA